MITIVDYGVGNLNSVANIIQHQGGKCKISSDPDDFVSAEKLILPGVGAFDNGMDSLKFNGHVEALNLAVVENKIPILGICLGMQLMTLKSEEGKLDGLGWVNAEVKKFNFEKVNNLKIPHMGWNSLKILRNNPLISFSEDELRFYFVHSYYVEVHNDELAIFNSNYGGEFCSGFQKDNIFGVQFHPEKSHKFGMNLIKNFINI
jgi:imidazole glycerol-phosphate synthase subunit HisH